MDFSLPGLQKLHATVRSMDIPQKSVYPFSFRWALRSFALLCVCHDLAAVTGSWTKTPKIVSQNPFSLYNLITIVLSYTDEHLIYCMQEIESLQLRQSK